ncbi:hypothetical protein [Paraconexibacter sp.]|uniref:hypothetical protein n=1 Tax=Paraconexibacter sp. TaxID=2949640 RepID=UPI00356824B0
MGMFTWVTMGLAIWHFTVFVPDRFAGGIVGAFLGALIGSIVFGLAIHGFDVPGRSDTDILTAMEAIPGAVLGLAVVYVWGSRQEEPQETVPQQ